MKKPISIIPCPSLLEQKDGYNIITKDILYISDAIKEIVNIETINSLLKDIRISHSSQVDNLDILVTNKSLDEESYSMTIEKNIISIEYGTPSGLFYALISLSQLLMTYHRELPCLHIEDKPQYQWRGFLLDTSRSFYSTTFIKKMIDACAFHKMNIFHWHLTDDQGWRLPVSKYPRLIELGTKRAGHTNPPEADGFYDIITFEKQYYTHEEIQQIVEYARERFITIVPEIELPGHVSALLTAYPEYGCLKKGYHVENRFGVFDDVLCLGDDKIFDLFSDIFDTVCSLFPGKYIHIGGDECPTTRWQQCPDCNKRLSETNLDNYSQLQSWATRKMIEIILSKGKIPIGWDEVIDNEESVPINKEMIIQSWRGTEGGEKAIKTGHHIIMSPQTHCYLNLKNYPSVEEPGRLGATTLEKSYQYSPLTEGIPMDSRDLIMGGECTLWTEGLSYSRISEYLLFPRFCAIAENLWQSPGSKNYSRFESMLEPHLKRLESLDYLYYKGAYK